MLDRIPITHVFPQLELGGPLKGVMALLKYLDRDRFDCSFVALSAAIHPQAREVIQDLGCAFHQLDQRGMWDLRALPALVRILRGHGTRVLHSTLARPDWYGAAAASVVRGLRTVTTIRGVDDVAVRMVSGHAAERVFTFVNRRVLGRMDRVVPHSKGLVDFVRRMGVDESRITYIPNGMDLEPYGSLDKDACRQALRERHGWNPDTPVVGFVGTMWPYKDHEGFVNAARVLRQSRPEIRFVAAGGGPLLDKMRAFVRDSGMDGIVEYPGFVDDIPAFHAALDVHLFLSFSEGLPRAVLESMAAGTPVAASAVTGVVDVVKDGVTGLLLPERDPGAAAEAVLKLLDDHDLVTRLVTGATRLVRGTYSAPAMAQAYADLYENLCSPA